MHEKISRTILVGLCLLVFGFGGGRDGAVSIPNAQAQPGKKDTSVAVRSGSNRNRAAPSPAGRIDGNAAAEKTGASAGSERTVVGAVRFLTSRSHTRVIVDLSHAPRYETHRLTGDAPTVLPPRFYIDILGAQLASSAKEPILVYDGLLRQVRVAQFSPDVVRVVLDMDTFRMPDAFLLADPHRLVIDIPGQNHRDVAEVEAKKSRVSARTKEPVAPKVSGIRKIVLDPGHGGKDPGAIGFRGVAEKDIVLSVAKKLAAKLRKEMAIEVVLTRKDDRFVSLEDRTAMANAENADLFISLHMNASPNSEARGLETYYLDTTDDEASRRLAARENGTSLKAVSDLQFILSDMIQNMKMEDSITLAHRLHGSLVAGMSKKIGEIKDLGVKKALFYVLVGARMPSVLVEMFFITNRDEGRAMIQDSHQDAMADALYQGIQKYNETSMAMKTL